MRYLPLYEAKMFHQFDHRWATFAGAEEESSRQGTEGVEEDLAGLAALREDEADEEGEGGDKAKTRDCTLREKQDPRYLPEPRYWVSEYDVLMRAVPLGKEEKKELEAMDPERAVALLRPRAPKWLLVMRSIARSTDMRSGIWTVIPLAAVSGKAPILRTTGNAKADLLFLSVLNSVAWDWSMRCKIGGTDIAWHYLAQAATQVPETIPEALADRILPLALELVYTSWHLRPLAEEVCKSLGLEACRSFGWELSGFEPFDLAPFPFDEERRARLRAELDALVARLYGLNRKQLRYILCPQGLSWAELENVNDGWEDPTCSGPHRLPAEPATDFPGETFRVLKEKEERKYGEYRTRRLVLEAWERLWEELGPVEPLPVRFGPNAPADVSRQDAKAAKGPGGLTPPRETGRAVDTGLFAGEAGDEEEGRL